MPKRKTKEEFIEYSKLIHKDKYDYSKVDYKNNKTKVTIICKEHGEFSQTPNDHIGNHGCRKCSEQNQLNYNLKEAYSKENENFNLNFYVIELCNNNDTYIKVGISKDIVQRFKNIAVKSKSIVTPLLILPTNLKEATLLEDMVLKNLKSKYKKQFETKFSGYSECLVIESKSQVIEEIKGFFEDKSPLVGKILDYEYNATH